MNPLHFAEVVAHLAVWQASLRDPKPDAFSCRQLVTATGYSMRSLHAALLLSGWHRAEIWTRHRGRRIRRVFYAPPGHKVPRPKRGRPRFSIDDYINIEIL